MPVFTPHPYQEAARQMIFRHAACGLFLEPGLGKAVADDTPVPMADGSFRRADRLKVGDLVVGSDGRGWPVEAVFPQGEKEALRVTLADGRAYVSCPEHLTLFRTEPFGPDRVAPLKEAMESPWWAIPLASGVECAGGPSAGDPAKLGGQMAADVRACAEGRAMGCAEGRWSPWLERLMRAPKEERLAFAFALLRAGADPETGAMPFDTSEAGRRLASKVRRLLLSAGVPAYGTFKMAAHAVAVSGAVPDGTGRLRAPEAVPVARVEALGERVPMRCFTVGSPDHTYLVGDYVVTHNTSTVLSAVSDMAPPVHQLVIAPKAIAKTTWTDEIDKWGFPVRWRSLISSPSGRDLAAKARRTRYAEAPCVKEPTMFFINQELVSDLVGFYRDMGIPWPFPIVIVDEFQGFKSSTSKRWCDLASVRPSVNMLVGLTGTPIPNGIEDIWAQMWLIDRGARLGRTLQDFHRRWFFATKMKVQGKPDRNGRRRTYERDSWHPRWDIDVEGEVFSRIRDVTMSVRNTELKMPDRVDSHEVAHLSADEMERYERLKKDLKVELGDAEVTAANAAVLSGKLCQMASGTLYVDGPAGAGGARPYTVVHDRKLELLSNIVENTPDNVMVAYWYKCDAERIAEALRGQLPRDQRVVVLDPSDPAQQRAWNAGETRVLLLHPASAGHGLNLQNGGHTLVWYTIPWSLECYVQTNARLWRQGQAHTTIVHHLVAEGTIDERLVGEVLPEKGRAQDALMDAVRRELS